MGCTRWGWWWSCSVSSRLGKRTGRWTNICMIEENQFWVGQNGRTISASVQSVRIFWATRANKLKGGKTYMYKFAQDMSNAFTDQDSGSGCQETNFGSFLFKRVANISTSGAGKRVQSSSNTDCFKAHSVRAFWFRERKSASTLRWPGTCRAESHTFRA